MTEILGLLGSDSSKIFEFLFIMVQYSVFGPIIFGPGPGLLVTRAYPAWSFESYFYALVLDRTSSGPKIPGVLLRNQPEDQMTVNYPDVFRWHSWYAIQNGLPIVRYLSHV